MRVVLLAETPELLLKLAFGDSGKSRIPPAAMVHVQTISRQACTAAMVQMETIARQVWTAPMFQVQTRKLKRRKNGRAKKIKFGKKVTFSPRFSLLCPSLLSPFYLRCLQLNHCCRPHLPRNCLHLTHCCCPHLPRYCKKKLPFLPAFLFFALLFLRLFILLVCTLTIAAVDTCFAIVCT